MRLTSSLSFQASVSNRCLPIVQIQDGTFYRHHPSSTQSNPPMFPNLSFSIRANPKRVERWAIVGPSSSGKTTFLEILRGHHICNPPGARLFPALEDRQRGSGRSRNPLQAIQYVGFGTRGDNFGGRETGGAYLSARYESRKEVTDFSVLDYLTGNTQLNPTEDDVARAFQMRHDGALKSIVELLKLDDLLHLPVNNLSNGQTRRAKIARALTSQPRMLLLDEPFLGLDPLMRASMSLVLEGIPDGDGPLIVLAVQTLGELPDWVTDVLYLENDLKVHAQGPRDRKIFQRAAMREASLAKAKYRSQGQEATSSFTRVIVAKSRQVPRSSRTAAPYRWHSIEDLTSAPRADGEPKHPLVEMSGVKISYGERKILGFWNQNVKAEEKPGLWWNIRKGDRWGVFGPNGSGKTTLLSLICSDHPQAYSLPIEIFGKSRLPEPGRPGISIFDIQSRIGHASPEIHNFFPRESTIRQTIENAWADTFRSKPRLTHEADKAIEACLRWFRPELDPHYTGADLQDPLVSRYNLRRTKESSIPFYKRPLLEYMASDIDWADNITIRDISFSSQRVALFLRAIIKKADLVILDEAFSGMDERTRIKCLLFLAYGETKWLWKASERCAFANRSKLPTMQQRYGQVAISGLEPRQALLSVSHRQEEVPPITNQWICLPEQNSGDAARFGTLPFEKTYEWQKEYWWNDIWNREGKNY